MRSTRFALLLLALLVCACARRESRPTPAAPGQQARSFEARVVKRLPALVERDPAFPFVVVSPQTAAGTLWTDTALLAALLDEVSSRYAVDASRVYLTGHSMGGNGAWFLAYTHPERFAAVAPMSGPANPWWASRRP